MIKDNWNYIYVLKEHRTDVKYCERYCNVLTPEISLATLTYSEDEKLHSIINLIYNPHFTYLYNNYFKMVLIHKIKICLKFYID